MNNKREVDPRKTDPSPIMEQIQNALDYYGFENETQQFIFLQNIVNEIKKMKKELIKLEK